MGLIVEKSKEIIEKMTPHAIAFYVSRHPGLRFQLVSSQSADDVSNASHQTSGQLLLEEYHALAMVGKGGLGTLTMDGNTRLCTATAATAMVSSEPAMEMCG